MQFSQWNGTFKTLNYVKRKKKVLNLLLKKVDTMFKKIYPADYIATCWHTALWSWTTCRTSQLIMFSFYIVSSVELLTQAMRRWGGRGGIKTETGFLRVRKNLENWRKVLEFKTMGKKSGKFLNIGSGPIFLIFVKFIKQHMI